MIKIFFALSLFSALHLFSADEHQLKVTGIGKATVRADVADVRLGIEVEEKTALAAQNSLSKRLPKLLESLQSPKVEKLQTGMVEIYPEYTGTNPPEIKSYRGVIDLQFSINATEAGEIIGKAFEAGANRLQQVALRPSDDLLQEARIRALKQASKNALLQVDTVLTELGLEKKEITNITVQPSEFPSPLYRNAQAATFATKEMAGLKISEEEQTIHSQLNLSIQFKP